MLWAAMVAALQLFPASSKAQPLAKGDLAIIGTNRLVSSPFELAIVALADIPSGRTIYICDFPYSNTSSGFVNTSNTSEGVITWTTTSQLNKGSVVLVKIYAATTTPVVSGLPGNVSVSGWSSGNTASTPAPAGGENWFIYEGTSALVPTNFIFAWTNFFASATGSSAHGWVASGQQVATNTSTSELPPSLTNGQDAISLAWSTASGGSHGDNNAYVGTTGASKATILSEICDYTKWSHDETITYKLTSASAGTTLNNGATYFSSFSVNTPPVAASVVHTGTLEVGATLTGNYSYSDANGDAESGSTFKWYRSDNGSGANKLVIATATAKTYLLTASDVGKYISFEVTPRDGTANGTAVESVLRGPVTAPVLPVAFISMTGERRNSGTVLTWKVASETNNSAFNIYRRSGEQTAVRIASIAGGGSHSETRTYSITDTRPLHGYSYYTLSQVDANGRETELSTVPVLYTLPAEVALFPNPAKDRVSATFAPGLYQRAELIDLSGSVKQSKAITATVAEISFGLSSHARGTYIIRLVGAEGSETRKFVKD